MGLIESLIYIMTRGIAIGVFISAPMGPVGILCIQRTLDKGRRAGFFTGIGAALSDLFYCLLTGFGLSFIEEFLERNQNVIQLVGSAVLIAFAVYLFRKNPAADLKRQGDIPVSAKKNILGGFLFTFSNPLILFLIIGLFARFNFMLPELRLYHYIVGYLFIFGGALGWWWLVTYSIDKVRAHFNLRSMWLINKIIGGVILLFAIVGIITGVVAMTASASGRVNYNAGRGYGPSPHATALGIELDNRSDTLLSEMWRLETPSEAFDVTLRVTDRRSHPQKGYAYTDAQGSRHSVRQPGWTLLAIGGGDTVAISVRAREGDFDGVSTRQLVVLTANSSRKGLLAEKSEADGLDANGAANAYRLRRDGDGWTLYGGRREEKRLLGFRCAAPPTEAAGVAAAPGGSILATDISLGSEALPTAAPVYTREELTAAAEESGDPAVGYWMPFDRSLEEDLLRMGGDYTLALMPREEGGYDIIYVAGAAVNAPLWREGMKKGELLPTPFTGVYDTRWTDASGRVLERDIKTQMESPSMLSIQFPYQNSVLRLRKVDAEAVTSPRE